MFKGIALVLTTLGIGFQSFAAPSYDELKIGISQEFDTIHPMIATMLASNYVYNLAGRSLLVLDAKGQWSTQLAKKIPSMKDGDAKIVTYNGQKVIQATWHLLENAKWSDGTPVTCADFKFALDVSLSPNVGVSSKEDYSAVEAIEWDAKTPKSCKFTYNKVRWDFYQIPRFIPLPAHIEKDIFEKHKNETLAYEKNSLYAKKPSALGLYNGPYQIAEVQQGSHIVFTPNPHFYGPAPKFKRIVVRIISNTSSLEASLLTNQIDMVAPVGFTIDQAINFEKKIKSSNLPFLVQSKSALFWEHIDINLDSPIFKDKKVRQALLYGVNREDLNKALFEGKLTISQHPIAPIDPWFSSDPKISKPYAFDHKKASQLLDEAGWKMDTASGYRMKNGERMSIQLMTTAGNKVRELVSTYLQKQWKDIGIEILIKNEPARVFFGDTIKKRKFSGLAMYANGAFPERIPLQLHSKSIPTEKNAWSGRNIVGWKNRQVDQTIDKLEGEFDQKKRKALAAIIIKNFTEEVPALSLFYPVDVAVVHKNLKNVDITGHQFSNTNQAEYWDLNSN